MLYAYCNNPQDETDLTFTGGFDTAPSPYTGTVDSEDNVTFTNGDGNCSGTIIDGVFSGACEYPFEECAFEYHQ